MTIELERGRTLGSTAFYRAKNGLTVLCGREPAGHRGMLLWHLSVAHPTRYPTWEELKELRYQLCPDEITMGVLFPPKDQWVNLHDNCFHLWEVGDKRE